MNHLNQCARLAGFVLALVAVTAAAQDYPARAIRVIVPYPAGGPTDTMARVVAAKMSESLGQPMPVENRPGAGTLIGTRAALQAPADGYTVLMHTTTVATNALAYKAPGYRLDDLTPIFAVASTAFVLAVPASSQLKSVADLVAYAKANPRKLNGVSLGAASSSELLQNRFLESAGIQVTKVPYSGSAPANQALQAGQVDLFLDGVVTQMQQMSTGKIRMLAISSEKRSPLAANIPTFAEQGYSNMIAPVWNAFLARSGTPAAVIQRLTAEGTRALATQDVRDRLTALGLDVWTGPQQEFPAFMRADIALWERDIRRAGLQLSE